MGGPSDRFQTTDWTRILCAKTADEDARRQAMGELIRRYWRPVYCYLRRKGHGNEEAKDLTQGFFTEVVLDHGLVQKAEAARGRFRNYLLVSLEHYVLNVHRANNSRRRHPDTGLLPLDTLVLPDVPAQGRGETPEATFNYEWAAALLEQAVEDVEEQCRNRDETTYWEVFRVRVIEPIMKDCHPPSLGEVCARLGIANAVRASNMIVTVKRRFRAALERRVRLLVASDADVGQEICELMAILSGNGAIS